MPFYAAPGILDECMHLFVASELTPGEPAREAEEEIENRVVSWNEALQMIHSGQIHDAKTLVGLLLYDARQRRQANSTILSISATPLVKIPTTESDRPGVGVEDFGQQIGRARFAPGTFAVPVGMRRHMRLVIRPRIERLESQFLGQS